MSMNPHNWSHLVFFAVHLAGSNVPIFNALYGLYQMTCLTGLNAASSLFSREPFHQGVRHFHSKSSLTIIFFHNMGKHFANEDARLETM